jgi:hypothetical protein
MIIFMSAVHLTCTAHLILLHCQPNNVEKRIQILNLFVLQFFTKNLDIFTLWYVERSLGKGSTKL